MHESTKDEYFIGDVLIYVHTADYNAICKQTVCTACLVCACLLVSVKAYKSYYVHTAPFGNHLYRLESSPTVGSVFQ